MCGNAKSDNNSLGVPHDFVCERSPDHAGQEDARVGVVLRNVGPLSRPMSHGGGVMWSGPVLKPRNEILRYCVDPLTAFAPPLVKPADE